MASSFRLGAGKSGWLLARATGTLPVIAQSPECCWANVCLGTTCFRKRFEDRPLMRAVDGPHIRMALIEKPKIAFRNHAENARNWRA
jgi:hypothetical protein